MPFDIQWKSIKTKTRRFIEGKVRRLPFETKINFAQQFATRYQTYLEIQVSGNMYGVKMYGHFVAEFRALLAVLMKFISPFVVIPFPEGQDSHQGRPLRMIHQSLLAYEKPDLLQ